MFKVVDIASGALIVIIFIFILVFGKKTRMYNVKSYQRKWDKIKKQCQDKKLWSKALVDADKLLDDALKHGKFKGKSEGERLVSAQRDFTSNDSVWFSHKLANKIKDGGVKKLTKKQTIEALASFHLALKDIGALKSERLKGKKNGK